MLIKLCVFLVILCFGQSHGVIYHLNETEYERLPRLYELENYEPCMEEAGGVYCVSQLELYTPHSRRELYTLIQEYSEHTLKHFNYLKLERGTCVTRTCATYAKSAGLDINKDLREVLEGCLNETIITKYDLMARVIDMSCEKEKEKGQLNLDYLDYIFLGVFIILLMLAFLGSFGNIHTNDNDKNLNKGSLGKDLLSCFSFPQNYKRLTTITESDSRLNIFKSIHAFRTLTTILVVHAHVNLQIGARFISDPHSFEKAYESVVMRIIFSGTNIVQVYFFSTGLLLTYFMELFSEKRSTSWKMIPKIIFIRWWRLTPSAAMLLAFSATWMRHLGSGPLWRPYVTSSSSQCRRLFWAHIVYINNYIPEATKCAVQTWYTAADFQLFIVGIILHFAIRGRSRNFKIITLTSLLFLSMTIPAVHVWCQDLDAFAMLKPEVHRTMVDATFHNFHVFGHNNLSSFIIGLSSGYLVYYLQKKKVEYPNFKLGNFLCWCLIPAHVLTVYCASLFYYDGERPSPALRTLYAGTNRAVFGLFVAFWMIGATLKFNGCSKAVMEWPGWVVPSRLTYSVFLLHNVFVNLALAVRTQLTPVSFYNTFFQTVGVLTVSYAIAIPFYLLIEAPTGQIAKLSTKQISDSKMD